MKSNEDNKTLISNILVRNIFLCLKQVYCCLTFVCVYISVVLKRCQSTQTSAPPPYTVYLDQISVQVLRMAWLVKQLLVIQTKDEYTVQNVRMVIL